MVDTATTCPHPPGSLYLDVDEEKCRLCNTSLTFPARAPGPQDGNGSRQGEHRKAAEEAAETAPVTVLPCTCCRESLPSEAFSTNRAAVHRGQRSYACRACTAFRQRVRLATNGEAIRQRNRERMAVYREQPGKREVHNDASRQQREAVNAAGRRYRARTIKGRDVPKQRAGRPVILLKQICRISENCPLRSFCTVENKGLE